MSIVNNAYFVNEAQVIALSNGEMSLPRLWPFREGRNKHLSLNGSLNIQSLTTLYKWVDNF